MKLETLKQKAKEDLQLSNELDRDSQDMPRRKAQWSEWMAMLAIDFKKAEWKLNKIKKEKFEYYYSNYPITLDKRDIRDTYLPGDDDVVEASKAVEIARQKVELCERTLRALTAAGFDIKNVIEYRKLMSGII